MAVVLVSSNNKKFIWHELPSLLTYTTFNRITFAARPTMLGPWLRACYGNHSMDTDRWQSYREIIIIFAVNLGVHSVVQKFRKRFEAFHWITSFHRLIVVLQSSHYKLPLLQETWFLYKTRYHRQVTCTVNLPRKTPGNIFVENQNHGRTFVCSWKRQTANNRTCICIWKGMNGMANTHLNKQTHGLHERKQHDAVWCCPVRESRDLC